MMKQLIFNLILSVSLFAGGCSFLTAKAEPNQNQSQSFSIESNSSLPPQAAPSPSERAASNPASVIGTYQYETEKNGEGYDNTLEVTAADDGKLFISLSGSYIYKVGETQSMHEAEGKGDAVLHGSRADATLVDEAGKPCRATITFKANTAEVKIPDTCQFNIALDGLYQKAGKQTKRHPETTKQEEAESESENLSEVSYEKMMDFINDFDAHKIGEEFVITQVPSALISKKNRADQFGNKSYQGLYYLEGVTDDDTPSYSVLTSKAMVTSLNQNAEYEPVNLRLTAVIAQSNGKFDVYRIPFVTKIEGMGNDGEVMWVAEGSKPAKLKFTH